MITPRRARYPPVPIGAELVDVETTEVIGTVTAVIAVQFDRYEIHYAAPEAEEAAEEPAETEEAAAEADAEAEAEADDEEGPAPLSSLELSPRVLKVLEGADVGTVEELRAIAEAGELGEIGGIGPASIGEIEGALEGDEAAE